MPTISAAAVMNQLTDYDVAHLIGCASQGAGYWAEEMNHDKVAGTLTVKEFDEDDTETTTHQRIKEAFAQMAEAGKLPSWQIREILEKDLAFDAYVGDIVIQQALFGKQVYA